MTRFHGAILLLLLPAHFDVFAQPLPPLPGDHTAIVLTNPPPGTVPQFPTFSRNPTTDEIIAARVFEEPLVPMWGDPTDAENKALALALVAFARRTSPDDFSALTSFLNSDREYHWHDSLLFCLGWEYYHTGYFSKAIQAWEEAWFWMQYEFTPEAWALADRTAGELAKMHARIGGYVR